MAVKTSVVKNTWLASTNSLFHITFHSGIYLCLKINLFFLILTILGLTACIYKPPPEVIKKIEALEEEHKLLKNEIIAIENENSSLSGGLIKLLIEARLEILKGTEALIKQRIHALESGAKISIVTAGSDPDPELVSELKNQIDAELAELTHLKYEASRYSGGLILAMKEASIATKEQTIAMLQQRYLGAKFGLPNAINCSQQSDSHKNKTGVGSNFSSENAGSSQQPITLPADDDSRL